MTTPQPRTKPYCPDYNAVGMAHCHDPLHCGGPVWPEAEPPSYRVVSIAEIDLGRHTSLDSWHASLSTALAEMAERQQEAWHSVALVPWLHTYPEETP